MNLKISEILKVVDGEAINFTYFDTNIKRVVIDSREVSSHTLFVAIRGKKNDGHRFIQDVVSVNSNFVISEEKVNLPNVILVENSLKALQTLANYIRNRVDTKIIGITGSNGKTTTKNILEQIIEKEHSVVCTKGNENNYLGLPLNMTRLIKKPHFGIFEMGISEINEMDVLCDILEPDIAIITSISESHLETLIDIEHVALEKMKSVIKAHEFGVVNGDIDLLKDFLPLDKRVFSFGLNDDNDFQFKLYHKNARIVLRLGDMDFKTNLIGFENAYSIMAAISTAIILGISKSNIANYIRSVKPIDGRMNIFSVAGLTVIDDAYNANPQSVKNLIRTVDEFSLAQKRYVILGEMLELGENSPKLHKSVMETFTDRTVYLLKGDKYSKNDFSMRNVLYFNSNKEIINYLSKKDLTGAVIGIKGSNSTKMNEIVDFLKGEKNALLSK